MVRLCNDLGNSKYLVAVSSAGMRGGPTHLKLQQLALTFLATLFSLVATLLNNDRHCPQMFIYIGPFRYQFDHKPQCRRVIQ